MVDHLLSGHIERSLTFRCRHFGIDALDTFVAGSKIFLRAAGKVTLKSWRHFTGYIKVIALRVRSSGDFPWAVVANRSHFLTLARHRPLGIGNQTLRRVSAWF